MPSQTLASTLDTPKQSRPRRRDPVKGFARELVVLVLITAVAFVGGVAVLAVTHSRAALACCSSSATTSR